MAEIKAWSDAEKYDTISVFIEKSIEKLPKITRRLNAIGYDFYSVEYASDFLEECQKCSWQKTIKKNNFKWQAHNSVSKNKKNYNG